MITPAILRRRNCRAISVAASQLVQRTVSRAVADRVNDPELTSITVRASVRSMMIYPPEGRSTRGFQGFPDGCIDPEVFQDGTAIAVVINQHALRRFATAPA